jgi:alanine racemase
MKSRKAKVHLKIDTGMERIGVSHKYAVEFVKRVAMMKNIDIIGIYSHFSSSDEDEQSFSLLQLERFHEIVFQLKKLGIEIPVRHIANSASVIKNPDSHFDLVRPGLILYGISPIPDSAEPIPVIQALTLSSKVVFIKRVPAHTGISYNRKYYTDKDSNIVTVPIGYGDGYSRLLTNKGDVLIHGKRYPVIGAVCMDQIMVNMGDDTAAFGDEVVLIGSMGDEQITAWEIAKKMGTIPYEITCMINARVPRLFINP